LTDPAPNSTVDPPFLYENAIADVPSFGPNTCMVLRLINNVFAGFSSFLQQKIAH
jgi:hypothetical protein